jgi:hypothetical protein
MELVLTLHTQFDPTLAQFKYFSFGHLRASFVCLIIPLKPTIEIGTKKFINLHLTSLSM